MKKKLTILLFGLLLAVGWTSNASAQSLTKYRGTKTIATGMTANAPQRVDENSERPDEVKPFSYYYDLMYTWEDAEGVHESHSTDVADKPEQMYSLLRYVYMTPAFPGPYYSAYDLAGNRQRKVYYGGFEGGWNVPGVTAASTPQTVSDVVTVANGTATSQFVPVYGYYVDYGFQDQMIYTASQLGLQAGDKITSLTFYPTSGTYSGTSYTGINFAGNITVKLANTTTSSFSGSKITSGLTTVATVSVSKNTSQTEWTINFSTPFEYTGGNLLVDVSGPSGGSYGRTFFVGQNQSSNVGIYSNASSSGGTIPTTGTNSTFLPKATFGYTGTRTVDPTKAIGEITITANNTYARITSIQVKSGNTVITSWDYATNANGFPYGWSRTGSSPRFSSNGWMRFPDDCTGVLHLASWLFTGYDEVEVIITGYNSQSDYAASLIVNGQANNITTTYYESQGTAEDKTWTISSESHNFPIFNEDTYTPDEEGYTVLVVSVKDTVDRINETLAFSYFADSTEIVNYFKKNVKFVKLLTDGLRIGEGKSIGTVFNCDGTYNKFFFLGKGQARQKADVVRNQELLTEQYLGESAPFRCMYEEFSPTGGQVGDQIYDFYSEMMDGHVYNVVHDCGSVLEMEHQFSMSGNKGTTAYGFTGLNFFVPDYRLEYWQDNFTYKTYTVDSSTGDTTYTEHGPYVVDGRIMNAYQEVTNDPTPAYPDSEVGYMFRTPGNWAAWYAQYKPQYAPKVGIYKITLEATAVPAQGYDEDTYPYYQVTLDWRSSLNEMTGTNVPQTYEIYEVTYDPETGEEQLVLITTVQNDTTYSGSEILYLQGASSVTHTYVIKGHPTTTTHSSFIAWSNRDDVVIPGLKDFLALQLDHYESDFKISEERNYYRNFLVVKNENELKALDSISVNSGKNEFKIYRYEVKKPDVLTQIATLNFDHPIAANAARAHYSLTYMNQNIEPGNITNSAGETLVANGYQRSVMGIPDADYVRIKGNGDVIIWPNGLSVNFKSIKVTSGNTTICSWVPANGQNPGTGSWILSPGSKWVEYGDAYYLEGLGYIAIPAAGYGSVNVEIEAFGDGTTTSKITVNDVTRTIRNNVADTYPWTVAAANRAPRKDGDRATTQVTFTAGTDAASAYTITKDGVTITNTQTSTNNNSFSYNPYRLYAGTLEISTTTGKITNIVFNGTSTTYPVSRISGTGYTYTDNTGTWTGDASNVSLTVNTGQVRASSIVVTVTDNGGQTTQEELITYWDYNETPTQQPQQVNTDWIFDDGGDNSGIDTGYGFWFNNTGSLTIPASYFANYTDIRVEISYAMDAAYSGSSSCYTSVNGVQSTGNNTTTFTTYTWTDVDVSNGIVIVPSMGYLYYKYIKVYGTPVATPPTPVTVDGMLRLAIPVVDQFYASTATNKHPNRYGYVLKYAPNTADELSSGRVEVPVQHTTSKVYSYYDSLTIDSDTDRHLETDMLSADVQMTLSATDTEVFYNTVQGKANGLPAEYKNYYTVLQRMTDGTYKEMKDPSGLYGKVYPAGTHTYYDSIQTKGVYETSYKTYVPVVMTMGHDRRYYELDSLHNTYGAPIWKTSVGKVIIESGEGHTEAQAQIGGGAQGTIWTEGDTECCLFFLGIDATGLLPDTTNHVPSNIEYEPYMFRVWIESAGNNLRGFTYVPQGDGPYDGAHFEGDGHSYSSILIYEKEIKDGDCDLIWQINNDEPWSNNLAFGAVKDIDDLKIYIRFYYKSKGKIAGIEETEPVNTLRADPTQPATHLYNVSESGEDAQVTTGINSVYMNYNKPIESVTYVNAQGMQSEKPFDGVNIVITRYTDGTTRTTKVVR